MTIDEFRNKVFEKLHEKGYSEHKTDEELRDAIEEYDDIIEDQYNSPHDGPRGIDHEIEDAAWNISMCI